MFDNYAVIRELTNFKNNEEIHLAKGWWPHRDRTS